MASPLKFVRFSRSVLYSSGTRTLRSAPGRELFRQTNFGPRAPPSHTIQRFNYLTSLLIMSTTSTAKSDYLLLFRGNVWDRGLSPAQLQKVVSDWMAWFERLKAEGKCVGGNPLEDEGKVISGKQRTVADGPFAESKEAIGGYFYLTVADEKEAIEIAKQCPGLEYGSVVEVGPVADECSIKQRAQEYSTQQLAGATA